MILDPADFCGRWQLSRAIDDRKGGQAGRLQGTATLRQDGPNDLHYAEAGSLSLGTGPVLQAERSYLWHFDKGLVTVRFADGRAFHSFHGAGISAGADHPCGSDLYSVTYDFTGWPVWQSTWVVTGPRKDYTSRSHYMRA
jgi:hypothetical protein